MIRLGADHFPSNVRVYVSDSRISFKLTDDFSGLTREQNDYLRPYGLSDSPRWIHMKQVHGRDVVVVDDTLITAGRKLYEADAITTRLSGTPVSVRTADCQAVFLYDTETKAIAAVHAGWKGTQQNVTGAAIERMTSVYGTQPKNIKAMFGPSIRHCCFEVGPDVAQFFPSYVATNDNGRSCVDLVKVNSDQMTTLGVLPENIKDCGLCSVCSLSFHSFRRDGEPSGRMIGVMIRR